MNRIIILAAGKGVRMNSDLPKVLTSLRGKPMISYLLKAVIKASVDQRPIIVVSPQNKAIIQDKLKGFNLEYVVQKRQLGTGHAVSCAKKQISAQVKNIIILNGDHPFLKAKTIKNLVKKHKGLITMLTTKVRRFTGRQKNFYHWGRIIRQNNNIKAIVEFKDASEAIKQIKEVNPAVYCFNNKWLWKNIKKIKNNNASKEYYLTDLIGLASNQGVNINSFKADFKEVIGINSQEELKVAENLMQN